MSESLSTFSIFPRLPGLLGAAIPGPSPAPARSRPLFLESGAGEGAGSAGSRGSLSFPQPLSFGPALGPSRPGGEENARPPRGRQGNIWAAAPQTSGAAAAHPAGPQLQGPAPGAARAGTETPQEGKEGGEGAARAGAAQVRAARPSPAAGRAGVKAGRAAGQGGGMSDIAGGKDNHSMFASTRPTGGTSEVKSTLKGRDFKSAMPVAKAAGARMRAGWPLQESGAFCLVCERFRSRGWGSLNKGETKCSA